MLSSLKILLSPINPKLKIININSLKRWRNTVIRTPSVSSILRNTTKIKWKIILKFKILN